MRVGKENVMTKKYFTKQILFYYHFKKLLLSAALMSAFLLLPAGGAQATIMFDFADSSSPSLIKEFEDTGGSGAILTVTGWKMPQQEGVDVTQENVSQTDRGLGVRVGPGDSALLDSFGPNEALLFTISGVPGLILEEITFTRYDEGDDFTFYIDRDPVPHPFDLSDPNDPLLGPGFDPGGNEWDISNDLGTAERTALSSFAIKVNNWPSGRDDPAYGEGLRIAAVYASHVSEPIPEPATIALLGIGLAGLAGAEVRRRRKKKAVNKS